MSWDTYQQNSTLRTTTCLARYAVEYQNLLKQRISVKSEIADKKTPVAIDLGCGGGVDSIFFAKQGYSVYAVDQSTNVIQDTINNMIASGQLTQGEANNIHIVSADFEKIAKGEVELPKADIVYSNFSLPFYTPQNSEDYANLMKNLTATLNEGGVIATTMLGKNDEWKNCSLNSKEDIEKYYGDFKVLQNNEKEVEAPCQNGDMKHWDVVESVFRKPFENEITEMLASTVMPNDPIKVMAQDENADFFISPLSTISDLTLAQINENNNAMSE